MSTKVPCVAVLPSDSLLGLARRAERTRPGEARGDGSGRGGCSVTQASHDETGAVGEPG